MSSHNYTVLNYTFSIDPANGMHKLRLTPLQGVYPTHSLGMITCQRYSGAPNGTGIEMSNLALVNLSDTWFADLKALLQSGALVHVSYECSHSPVTLSWFSFG